MLEHYLPVVYFTGLAFFIGTLAYALGGLFGPSYPDAEKTSAYECGFEAFDDARTPFDVRFYLVAILFIVFDLETAFFFPFAVVLKKLSWTAVGCMGLFLLILTLGFVYEWRKGALEW